jgi:DUF4097 and DUF4098 domain-containing protein YvlB
MRREEQFDVGDRGELVIVAANSEVVIKEGEPGRIHVVIEGSEDALDRFDITHAGDLVSIRLRKDAGRRWMQPSADIAVTLPPESDVDIRTASGDVFGSVETRTLTVSSASGDVRFGPRSRRVKVKTASGDIVLDEVSGDLEGASASGDFSVGAVGGDVSVSTASGDVLIGEANGRTSAKSASGDIRIRRFDGPSLNAATMSGDVTVGLAAGMAIDTEIRTLSGEFSNNVKPSQGEPTRRATLQVKTMSGDVTLRS